jgi:hypothetical protein
MQEAVRDLPERVIEEDAKLDQFTDSASDEQNNFELEVPVVDKLMKEFEQGDNTMKEMRDKSPKANTQHRSYKEELVKLNNNIR